MTLADPLGPPARGWDQVEKTLDRSVPQMRDGEPIRFERAVEYADGNLAYILESERWRGKARPGFRRTLDLEQRPNLQRLVRIRLRPAVTLPRRRNSSSSRTANDVST